MMNSIDFNSKTKFRTIKIDDISSHAFLSSELRAQAVSAQTIPKHSFSMTRGLAKIAAELLILLIVEYGHFLYLKNHPPVPRLEKAGVTLYHFIARAPGAPGHAAPLPGRVALCR